MVEELKLAIKVDDDSIEQSLLKQFANAQKMADKVVLDFKNVNFDDKEIEAKFKALQKKAGQNPIDLSINKDSIQMLSQISDKLGDIFKIAQGKSIIDSSSIAKDIGKVAQATNTQANAIDKVTSSYKNQAYELASVLKMLAKLDKYSDVPYADAMSRAVKSSAKSYKNGNAIQFTAKQYGMDEEDLKYLRGLSVNLSNAFNYTDTFGLDTANISDVEKLTAYFRELLKEKLEFNNTKLNTSDIEELIKALGILKKEHIDDGTKSGRNVYGDAYLDKYSNLDMIKNYLKEQEKQALATAEAEQKLAEVQKETVPNTSNSNNSQIEELKTDIQEVKTELGDVKDRLTSIESNGFENVREDVEKTKESVKELNSELTEMKTNISSSTSAETNISSGLKDAFQGNDEITSSSEKVSNAVKEENNILEQNTQKAKENAEAKEKMANADKEVSNANFSKYDNRLESYNKKTSGYDATIARFEDGGWTSDAYLKNVQAVKDAVAEYERILNNLKAHPELVTEEGLNDLAKQEKLIKENITAVQNMSAAEKGFTLLSGQKAMDKINSILKENSAMSREAKNQIRAWYNEIASGNPSKNLSQILGEVQKIVNAEAEAGRAGKSMMDSIKEKAWYGVASAIGTYFGFNDILRYGREAIDTVVQLDDALVDLKKTTSMSSSELENFYYDSNDVAKQMGVTTAEIINQASAWSRLNKIGLLYGDI